MTGKVAARGLVVTVGILLTGILCFAPASAGVGVGALIGDVRSMELGSTVILPAKVVTRALANRYYIEEVDRSAGIAVLLTRDYVPGTMVDVTGVVALVNNEIVIDQAFDTASGQIDPLEPLKANFRDGTIRMADGLLMTLVGKVVAAQSAGSAFRVDDGSGIKDEEGVPGLRVFHGGMAENPAGGSMVAVTGARGWLSGRLGVFPVLYVNSVSDVVVLD